MYRAFYRFLLSLTAMLLLPHTATAADFPSRPLRFVVPYAPGGPVDIVGRLTAQRLSEALGQQVIVDNRAGGGGNIAVEIVARANADGYTLLMASNGPIAINPNLYAKLPVDPQKDLAAVTMIASSPLILVLHPSVTAATVKDFVQLAKSRPATINYASSGSGSTAHLATELFRSMAGIQIVHVPYKGAGPALGDLVGGQVQAMITGISSTLPYVKTGRLRAVAVTSDKRLPLLPDIPAIAETLPGYEVITWYGLFAPAGTPTAVIERLHNTLHKVFGSTDAQGRLAALGADPVISSPRAFSETVRRETVKWSRIVRESGARPE